MIKNDYTKEIGLKLPTRRVPLPYALLLLALLAVVAWYLATVLNPPRAGHHPAKTAGPVATAVVG